MAQTRISSATKSIGRAIHSVSDSVSDIVDVTGWGTIRTMLNKAFNPTPQHVKTSETTVVDGKNL